MEQGSTTSRIKGATAPHPRGETSSTLADKLETMGRGVTGTVQDANTAVSETMATAKAAVVETVDQVKGAFRSLGRTFDLRRHVRHYPWFMLVGAALVGYVVGSLRHRAPR